jgi:peptide chain release factor
MRTQVQNKKLARERLVMKLSVMEEEKQMRQTHDVWMNHNTLERGNPVKRFKGDL